LNDAFPKETICTLKAFLWVHFVPFIAAESWLISFFSPQKPAEKGKSASGTLID
jgi:hypothetical protein